MNISRRIVVVAFVLLTTVQSRAQNWVDTVFSLSAQRDIQYGTALNFNNQMENLQLDLYLPDCSDIAAPPRPLFVWIHGGAFLSGNKNDAGIVRSCSSFAKRGYVCASLDYRLGFVADSIDWKCNYPNYGCVFAADTSEWIRAWYRGVQDAKGAVRWLVRHATEYNIDPQNIFLAGESAGSFVAMGVAYLDTAVERPEQTLALSPVKAPAQNSRTCVYAVGKDFGSGYVERPDLGDIEGTIESGVSAYTIKAVGNNYGGMIKDLLRYRKESSTQIPLFSFHQPCDMVVPIDEGRVYQGLSWCMTNGYGCYGIAHTPLVHGSRAISAWNTRFDYGYEIHNEFTSQEFPFSFLLGPGSCADQVNNPCHAYDNVFLRDKQLAQWLAPKVSSMICGSSTAVADDEQRTLSCSVVPSPLNDRSELRSSGIHIESYTLCNALGQVIDRRSQLDVERCSLSTRGLHNGLYLVLVRLVNGSVQRIPVVKLP